MAELYYSGKRFTASMTADEALREIQEYVQCLQWCCGESETDLSNILYKIKHLRKKLKETNA